MGIEKDTAFKFIGKNFLEILFKLANLPENIDTKHIEEITEELISLRIAQYRPDFIGKNDKIIVMFEFESSYVGKSNKKRFHAYVALYDYEKNNEDLDIIFCVFTTKEKTKIVEHKIGNTDSFKIFIFNIQDLGFEKIISNAKNKIDNKEIFSVYELVELALTSLMPGKRQENINQFYELSKMSDKILFEDDESKTSFYGLILLLSNLYFDENDDIRKKLQSDFMGKVDCIVEMREDAIHNETLRIAKNFLKNDFPVDVVSKNTGLSISKIEELLKEIG